MSETFITEFHNIPGDTFKQKYENFYQLLLKNRTALFADPIVLNSITKNLTPENHLEKIFRTNFLIYFRRFDELYEDFKNGDEITKKKLAKEVWFYEQAFKKVTCKEFVEMLPKISYSLKITILRKLPVDEQRADEIFDSICDKYGIFLATNLITRCSSEKISDALKKFPIKLSVAQLKSIYFKDPDLIHGYFEHRARHEGMSSFDTYKPFFIFLAQKNPQIFRKLFKLYGFFRLSLGRRTSKKFIISEKRAILDDKRKFLNVLNKSVAVRKLGPEIRDILFDEWNYTVLWRTFLKFYPKSIQFEIFKTGYDKKFQLKFGENIDSITDEILKIVSDPLERERLAKLKREKEGEDRYLKYMTPKFCWKEVTEKIDSLTSTERSTYIQFVAESCILNEDFETLLEVAESICVRFKNDTYSARTQFIYLLTVNDKILDSCDERIWKCIVEILCTIKAKEETLHTDYRLYYKYAKFLVENQRPLTDLPRAKYGWHDIFYYSKIKPTPKVYRGLIELLISGLTPGNDDEDDDDDFVCTIAYLCKDYNGRYPDDFVDVSTNPRLVESAKKILESNRSYLTVEKEKIRGLEYIVQNVPELQNLYFKNFKDYGRPRGMIHFLKHNPKTVVDNFYDFIGNFGEIQSINTKKFWFLIKKSTYLGLDRRSVEFCLGKLKEKENKNKEKFVKALAILQPPEEYLKLVEEYKPTCDKVDLSDTDVKDLYNLQGKMVKCLKFVNSRERVLEASFDFCRGDFLQFALTPLYSCLYKTPEVETTKFIEKLDKIDAFSVKKHSTHLVYLLNDKRTVSKVLQKSKIPPFIATFKYFAKNPSEDLWKIVEGYIDILEKNELNLLKVVAFKITVPMEYKGRYVEAIWRILDKYKDEELLTRIIPSIRKELVQKLSTQFAFEIIRNGIFKSDETNDLIASIFMFLSDEKKFSEMSDILSSFKKQYFNSREDRTARQKLASFVVSLFSNYIACEEGDEEFVVRLLKIFTVFPMAEAFDENIIIKCMSFKNQTTIDNIAKILINLNGSLDQQYGNYAVQLLTNVMKKVIFKYLFKTEEKIELCHCLLKRKERISDNLLILNLLPTDESEDKKHFALFEEIMKEIRGIEEKVVKLRLNLFLKAGTNRNWESNN